MKKLLCGLFVLGAIIGQTSGALAQTSSAETSYLNSVRDLTTAAGIDNIDGVLPVDYMLSNGYDNCTLFKQGYNLSELLTSLVESVNSREGLSNSTRSFLRVYMTSSATSSRAFLCPDQEHTAVRRVQTVWTVAADVNLRTGASTSSRVMQTLSKHTLLRVHANQNNWAWVQLQDTQVYGWVRSDFIGMD